MTKETGKVINAEIWVIKSALPKLLEIKFPVLTSYKLVKFAESINSAWNSIETVRLQLVDKHGDTDNDGNKQVPPKKFDAFKKEFTVLLEADSEIDFEEISIPAVVDGNELPIDANTLTAFGRLIKFV